MAGRSCRCEDWFGAGGALTDLGSVGSGRVIAAKVQLAMNVVSMFARIPLQDYSST